MPLVLDTRADLALPNYRRAVWAEERVVLGERAIAAIDGARAAFLRYLEKQPGAVYGVTSGYGYNARKQMDAAEAALTDRGVAKDRIHIERFLAGRPSAALAAQMAQLQEKAAGLTLSVTLDGRTRKVEFTEANILDSAREAGLPAPFACKAGVCATCRAKVTKGKVEMAARYGLTDEEIAAGYVLTCQSVPVGEGVAVDYDA